MKDRIKLLNYSKGSGCGCKIAPDILQNILSANRGGLSGRLLAGPTNNEDAAVYDLMNGECLISTTDFFLPVVNDAFDFGRIAAANALSDVYAMGGTPQFALGILGWPLEKIPVEYAKEVMAGASEICLEAGIPLAGGHSIESSDPIFGLCVNGLARREQVILNSGSKAGDVIYMTKSLGLGILSAAMKRDLLTEEEYHEMLEMMISLNTLGSKISGSGFVSAMTDITGFGFAGHLTEMALSANCTAIIEKAELPVLASAKKYGSQFVYPDITTRNFNAYASGIEGMNDLEFLYFCDPQTSGGLLISVKGDQAEAFEALIKTIQTDKEQIPVRIGHWEEKNSEPFIIFK